MKCINKKKAKKGKQSAKMSKKQIKKVKKTVFLILFFVILLLSVMLGFLSAKNRSLKEARPYSRSIQMFGTQAKEESLTAEGLAENFCVGPSNAPAEDVEEQEGMLTGLFDINGREVLSSRGLHERVSPGRISQLMTALLVYEKLDMEDSLTIEQEDLSFAWGTRSTGLENGDEASVRQLFNAVLVYSAEDACRSLAKAAAGSKEKFVSLMNEKAREIGMMNTQFSNVTGALDDAQYTTVYDIYLLLNELLAYPDIINAMQLQDYIINATTSKGELNQAWLASDNQYVTGKFSVPKGVTVLGGKSVISDSGDYTALLVQNQYGEAFAVVVLQAQSKTDMEDRIYEMLEKVNS